MNRPSAMPLAQPTAACETFAPALPLISTNLLDPTEADHLREHLAGCPRCLALADTYDRMDVILRSASGMETPPATHERSAMRDVLEAAGELDPAPEPSPPHTRRPARQTQRALSGVASLAAVLLLALLAQMIFSSRTHPGLTATQRATPTPALDSVPVPGSEAELASISMVSPTEGWAIGRAADPPSASATPSSQPSITLMHFTRGLWGRVPLPYHLLVQSISMDSPTDGWAVGDGATFLHYDGHTWTPVSVNGGAQRVQMLSASDGWAVGDVNSILHYDGVSWTRRPFPTGVDLTRWTVFLNGLSMLSAEEGWAVGTMYPVTDASSQASDSASPLPTGVVLHYTHGSWEVQSTFAAANLRAVSMVSAEEGWAVGDERHWAQLYGPHGAYAQIYTPLILHYSGGQWQKAALPTEDVANSGGSFSDVAMLPSGEGWISGGNEPTHVLLLHHTGGRWTQTAAPDLSSKYVAFVRSVAALPSGEAWAVGASYWPPEYGVPGNSPSCGTIDGCGFTPSVTPLILHYSAGAWNIYAG